MISNEEFLKKFSRKIIAVGGDFKTAKTYSNNIGMFIGWGNHDSTSILLCELIDLENYIVYLREQDYSPSYINSFIASIKRLYKINGKFAKCKHLVYHDDPIKTPNVLTYEECMAMCDAPIYLKHKAIINLLYYGALRRSELLNLKIERLSSDRRITIIGSKYGKSRVITIPQSTKDLLLQYLVEFSPRIYVFNGEGDRLQYSAKSVENVIKNTAVLCDIQKRVYPHILRSSRATHLLDNGASDMYVSEFLGHADIQTTRDYYCRLTIKGMQDNFDRVDEKLQRSVTNYNFLQKLHSSVTLKSAGTLK